MLTDRALLREYRVKRLQRGVEYALLVSIHFFFLLAFREYYDVTFASSIALVTFGMNYQLTELRERRRSLGSSSRKRLMADTFESILFLLFIILLSFGGFAEEILKLSTQQYYAYLAAVLGGIFLGALVGEVRFQLRRFPRLDEKRQRNYIANLRRTIILPYTVPRRVKE